MTDIKHPNHEYEDLHSMKAGQTGGGGGNWLRDQYKRLHNMAGDLHTSPELIKDEPSQPETSDNSHLERLPESSKRLSALNTSLKLLKQDAQLLGDTELFSPEEREDFSRQFGRAHAIVKLASHKLLIWEAANALVKTNPTEDSDNRIDKIIAKTTKILDASLKDLEHTKKHVILQIEDRLKEHFQHINVTYKNVSARASKLDDRESVDKHCQTYKDLASQFIPLGKKVRKNYGTSTYAECMHHLHEMEASLYAIVQERYPVVRNTVSQIIKPITEDTKFINELLKRKGIAENPYNSKVWEDRLEQVKRKTVRNLLTLMRSEPKSSSDSRTEGSASKDRAFEGKATSDPQTIFQDLHQFISDVHQARERCEHVDEIDAQVHARLDNIKDIVKPHQLSEMLADRFGQKWWNTFQKKQHDVLQALQEPLEGTNGDVLKQLEQSASEVEQAENCCYEVDRVKGQVFRSLDDIQSILQRHNLSQTPADRFSDTLQEKPRGAFEEALQGTNGDTLEQFEQFASDVHQANWDYNTLSKIVSQSSGGAEDHALQQEQDDLDEMRTLKQIVSDIHQASWDLATKIVSRQSSGGAEDHALQQEQYDALLEAIQGRHEIPAFQDLKKKFQVREQELEAKINERYKALEGRFEGNDSNLIYNGYDTMSFYTDMDRFQSIPSVLIDKRFNAISALQKGLISLERAENSTGHSGVP